MPNQRRNRSWSHGRSRPSPYSRSRSSEKDKQRSSRVVSKSEEDLQEWEGARCSVCMEHPHNAVLLICSSHKKGCRPFMCDTSYRHSNCLDQYCKASGAQKSLASSSEMISNRGARTMQFFDSIDSRERSQTQAGDALPIPAQERSQTQAGDALPIPAQERSQTQAGDALLIPAQERSQTQAGGDALPIPAQERSQTQAEGDALPIPAQCDSKEVKKISCPLCRGQVEGWIVNDEARQFMNAKARSCSSESCPFSGNYADLRKHARNDHPQARPTEVDQERKENWRRLEIQRDFGDVISSLRSSFMEPRARSDDGDSETDSVLVIVVTFRRSYLVIPRAVSSSPSEDDGYDAD